MKFRFLTYISVVLLLCCCNTNIYDSGVSKQLAESRKTNIKDLEYSLHYNIPESKDSTISGKIYINFTVEHPQEIIIDFREGANVREVVVNGKVVSYKIENEHIIIHSKAINKGDNSILVSFLSADQSLNRSDEFLYTLLVPDRARTIFPCFDQPDMKATFSLSLELPEKWIAVSNSPVCNEYTDNGRKHIEFLPTEPLSTYLFSFVAGIFSSQTYNDGNHTFTAYHRETEADRIKQLPTIFDQVEMSLAWLEEYTGIAYPFAKYDFIILPGFQYGGMEHTGATLYNDNSMFLSNNPTPDEELSRAHLIAHETAHMWFGDFVTMKWFDDVWTKEVFANYFASRITEPMFPDVNHRLEWLKSIVSSALSEDRTLGGTSIRQPLDNMSNAGLIYNNIIYNKAPVMLEKLVEIMGEQAFRKGIHEYLVTYSYNNASWPDLIQILDEECPEDLSSFSNVWVNSKGMPFMDFAIESDSLVVTQSDPYDRGLIWPQSFKVCLVGEIVSEIEVKMSGKQTRIPLEEPASYILPNNDGRGYGYFRYDKASLEWVLKNWYKISDETCRQSQLMNLNEGFQHGEIDASTWLYSLLEGISHENNTLIASTICSYINRPLAESRDKNSENAIWKLANEHPLKSCRQQLLRILISTAQDSTIVNELYRIWTESSHQLLNENDYTNMAYELAIRLPEKQKQIIAAQSSRITNPDRKRQFDYISRATTPDVDEQEALFYSLLEAENRRVEPWALRTLGYLCHPLREEQAVKYIHAALESLPYIQRTSDIFFPMNWSWTLLKDRCSKESLKELEEFLKEDDLSELLESKVLQASWDLQRRCQDSHNLYIFADTNLKH